MSILSGVRKLFNSNSTPAVTIPPAAGVYHFLRESETEKTRVHLRVEADNRGLLLVNAARSYHLNPSATSMAYLFLSEVPEDQAVRAILKQYQISRAQAHEDYHSFQNQFAELLRPDGACPIHDLGLDTIAPFSTIPSAPYRMDLAITYRCNNNCAHCYNARARSYPEITTGEWKQILDTLWQKSIPHIVFTGGEPTTRPDLPELIAYAEKNGQITGINTNGRKLANASYLQSLVDAGLDHIQITLESHLPEIHDQMVAAPGAWQETVQGIRNAVANKTYLMTNTTLLRSNSPYLEQTLDFLAELGVPTVGLNALIYSGHGETVGTGIPEKDLPALLEIARRKTEQNNQRLIWYTPTQYCHFDPVAMELGIKGCTAARYNMCVEPDGGVIPCQSYYQSLGNLLRDSWDSIWNHDLAVSLRERKNIAAECKECLLLAECGGGCPLARKVFQPVTVSISEKILQ